ncbi:MAG TPA: HD domain-containing phosphohydrolase [Vicinamibacterales bacterium]|nr:HD domain-containing phosphohydrolase [Vicinamibacterales bacterium]
MAVASALVPLALFGSVVFARARTQLEAQERQRLHQDTKNAALNGLTRLKMLEEALRWLAPPALDPGLLRQRSGSASILDAAESLTVVAAPGGRRVQLKGGNAPPDLQGDQVQQLLDGAALLLPGPAGSYWLIVGGQAGSLVAALVPVATIFDFGGGSSVPAQSILCVEDASAQVSCSDDDARTVVAVSAAGLPVHGQGTLTLDGAELFARTWTLPLQAEYHAGVWTAVMLAPQVDARATLWQLQRDVILLTITSLIVVILAVLAAVRRNLRPLSALEAAAISVGRQHFDVSLDVTTGDEFQTLADGFNGMVAAIRAQVEDLKAFSVGAATALARTIDAKSPWTAGHSERVTAMSLEIARALALPAGDLMVLHRGGLLHDIGKLATPPEILDKPGRLTPEERARIEQHPQDGVRILVPIADFAPLLPIVLEHHERFDGQGYPDGKAGEGIHRLARVLAVADVYDALVSDRPYRPGLGATVAIDHIRTNAGTHFDPVVVEAFLRVVGASAAPRHVDQVAC